MGMSKNKIIFDTECSETNMQDNKPSLPATIELKNTITSWSNDTIEMKVIKKTGGKGRSNLSHLARALHAWFTLVVDRQTKALLNKMGYENIASMEIFDYEVDLVESGFVDIYRGNAVSDEADVIVESHAHISKDDISKAVIELRTDLDLGFVNSSKVMSSSLYERIVYDPDTNICNFSMHKDWVPMFASCLGEAKDRHAIKTSLLCNFRLIYSEKLYTFLNGKIQSAAFKRTGELRCAVDTFKDLFGVEKGTQQYETLRFINGILNKSIKEVKEKSDLSFDVSYEKIGRSYKYILFSNFTRKGEDIFNQEKERLAENYLILKQNESHSDKNNREDLLSFCFEYGEKNNFTISEARELFELLKPYPTAKNMLTKAGSIFEVAKSDDEFKDLNKFQMIKYIIESVIKR